MKHSSIASTQYILEASDLQVVLALARAGTLAGAGARLAADVSTVFRSIQRIEKNLGQRLFERTRSGYVPMDAAQALCVHAERIEAELEEARAATLAPAQEVSGRVRLTTVDTVLRGLVLPLLPSLAAQHPQLQLELRATNELVSLTKRDADLALRAVAPGSRPPGHLIGRELGTIRFVVAASKSTTPAQRRRALDAHRWIAPDEAMPEHPSVRWRRRAFPKLAPHVLVDGIANVADAIHAQAGIGIVPLFMVRGDERLVALGKPLEACESQLWLLAHPESRHLRRIAAVYRHLVQHLALP